MLNSVSFAAKHGIYDRPNVDAPQSHQQDRGPLLNHPPKQEPKKSSHRALKFIAGLVATAAVAVAGIAVAAKKGFVKPDVIKKAIPEKLLNWEKVASWKAPVKKGIAAVEKFGNTVADKAVGYYTKAAEWVASKLPKKAA